MKQTIHKAASLIAAAVLIMAFMPFSAFAAAEGDWEYKVDGKNAIITRYTGADANPVTPAKLGGKPVTGIAADSFGGCTIESLTLSAGIQNVEPGSFFECKTIRDIKVDGANPVFTAVDGVLFRDSGAMLVQYPAGKPQLSYSIPDGVVTININAFDHNFFLTQITIPESVTTIGLAAFWRCNALKTIRIPAAVTSIGNSALANCNSLESIEVAEGNPNFRSDGFVLYSKDGKRLMQCPASVGESYVVPDHVTALDEGSFRGCISLRSVTIGDSVTHIGGCAFAFCENLEFVSIGKNVASIGGGAFQGSIMMKSVVLPASLKELGGQAFGGSPWLASAYFMGAPPKTFDDSAFVDTAQSFTVYYPESKKKAWAKFKAYPAKTYAKLPEPASTPTPQPTAAPTATVTPAATGGTHGTAVFRTEKPMLISVDSAGKEVRLIWKSAPGAAAYEVYRSTAYFGAYTKIASTGTCSAAIPSDGKRYCYKVKAVGIAGAMTASRTYSNIMYDGSVLFRLPS